MRIKYSYRKLYTLTLIFHAITCITCSLASCYLRDFRSSSGSFGSPMLATFVELIQMETELSSLKTDVMMTADRCSDLTYVAHYGVTIVGIKFHCNQLQRLHWLLHII